MLRGTKKLSYQQFRDQLDQLSATLSAGGGGGRRGGRGGGGGGGAPGAATFSIQAKRDTLPAVLELFQQVLREPALPAEEFEVLLRERLASLEQSRSEPAALAPRLLQRLLNSYPADDIRYVPTIDESIGRLRQVTHEKVLQLYRDYLGSQAGELTLVGDFDADACLPILKGMLRGWTAPKPYARIPNPITGEVKPSQHKINTPDKANATFTSGLRFALRDDDADYPALLMGNYILGSGTLSSRLGIRVRQKEGLSYGITSALNASAFDRRAGFTISAICNPQNIGRLEVAVREELDRLLRDGVTQAELDQARQGYLQSQQVSRANDAALGGLLSSLRYEGRTMAQQAAQEESIGTLTATKVNAALRQHLDLAKLVTVTAGDFGGQASSPGSAGERSTGERGASGSAGAASGGPTVAQAGAGTLEARGAEAADVLTPEQKTTGWKLLFNGKDFTGWHSFGTNTVRPGWQVKDGILVCADPKNAGDLCTDEKYDSFELVLDYNITPAGNSGIMYHVTDEGRAAWATGPEVQLEDNQAARDPQRCGWLYALYQPEPDPKTGQPLDATKPAGQWNQIRLVITPEKCEHYVNGVKYFEYVLGSDDFKARVAKSKFGRMPRFAKSPSGYLALQGDHGQVSFRNLKLRALGTGK